MKLMTGVTAVCVAGGLCLSPMETQAGDEGWAALGGLIGGLALGQISSHSSHTVVHRVNSYSSCDSRRVTRHRPRTTRKWRYEYITERHWVPGCWVFERDRCGRRYRVWQDGYYETVRRKVRVPVVGNRRASRDW